jgi:hypothetical protein
MVRHSYPEVYIEKPVPIVAMQWEGSELSEVMEDFLGKSEYRFVDGNLYLRSNEDPVAPGDYVIRHPHEAMYFACDPVRFRTIYTHYPNKYAVRVGDGSIQIRSSTSLLGSKGSDL